MGVTKIISFSLAALAIFVGSVGKFSPHVFMNLPFPLSIILWASTGNEVPPFFMRDAWKEDEIGSWTKDGDLVVATGAKSGTTMMLYCTHQIRTHGKDRSDELFPDVNVATPWMDLRQSVRGNWAEQKERYNTTVLEDGRLMKDVWDHPSLPFRIFKSHYGPPTLPVRQTKNLKYIAMSRNGLDVAASLIPFFSQHTDHVRKLWGGFPPVSPDLIDTTEATSHPIIEDLLPGGNMFDLYFKYVRSWWDYRNDSNVLLLHYADVRKDLKGNVEKIAKFLDVDLTPSELKGVTHRCSIEHMRTLKTRFNYLQPLNTDDGWDNFKHAFVKEGKLVGKGEVGKGSNKFSQPIVEKWQKVEVEQFGHDTELLKWAREGGSFS